jgi:hypothetical protein
MSYKNVRRTGTFMNETLALYGGTIRTLKVEQNYVFDGLILLA